MKLLVGLGNPGEKYKNNRHNVGHMFVDYLLKELASSPASVFKADKYAESQLVKLEMKNGEILLAKPMTFMNKSGVAVRKLFINWKLKIENLIVAHDDLDIPLGKFHIQVGVGPQLHNGLESIEQILETKEFTRIRIGVDARPTRAEGMYRENGEAYVLQNFSDNEKNILINELFPKILAQLKISGF